MLEFPSASTSSAAVNYRTMPERHPPPKRAYNTWPGTEPARSHFEDFLREIGATTQAYHLCCVPRPSTRFSCRRVCMLADTPDGFVQLPLSPSSDKKNLTTRSRPRDDGGRPSKESTTHPEIPQRKMTSTGSFFFRTGLGITTLFSLSGDQSSGSSNPLKTTALSAVDQHNHDSLETHDLPSSARDSLHIALGGASAVEHERPSHVPVRTTSDAVHPHDTESTSRRTMSFSTTSDYQPVTPSIRSHRRSPSVDSLDTASSSEAPATPRTHSLFAQEVPLSPSLADLEDASRFRVQAVCVTCKKTGANFPSCAKCGEMWCSRDCRLQGSSSGRRHMCHNRAGS
ncbi:hypothetical protein A0H81_11360 [Grifola frondosa]|uniref:Uncharacterized protein n=1 Tax=Grifola frondosa TaxID=5627 RepID=A0A1C7LVL9_GRIFR|nr:hypothetical protein A0H81_11360 [Grifola frondosa]